MKNFVVFFVIMLSGSFCWAQTAMYQYNITLRNNDTAIIQPDKYLKMTKYDELRIAQNFSNSLVSSTILKAMGVDAYKSDIEKYCKNLFVGIYKYDGYMPYYSGNLNFIHSIIRIKKVRDLSLQLAGAALRDLCRLYPQDFTGKIYLQLCTLQDFFSALSQHEYEAIVDSYGNYNLYIDGIENNEYAHHILGFLMRRVVLDQVSIQEIIDAVSQLRRDMESVFIDNNKDIYSKITINNEVDFCNTTGVNYYHFKNSDDTCYLYPRESSLYMHMHGSSTIKFYKDNGESYYLIETGYVNYKNEWKPETGRFKQKILLDSNGNVIYRE